MYLETSSLGMKIPIKCHSYFDFLLPIALLASTLCLNLKKKANRV